MTATRPMLVTVATEAFVPGALVMLDSFLRHHRAWHCDVTVIGTDLSVRSRELIDAIAPGACVRAPSAPLVARLAELGRALPSLVPRLARFYSLDALQWASTRRVVFCDSDVLFQRPVPDLFGDVPFLAAGDVTTLRGAGRNRTSFGVVPRDDPQALPFSFNAGVMAFGPDAAMPKAHAAALDILHPDRWARFDQTYTDQLVFNQLFAEQAMQGSWSMNYLLAYADELTERTGMGVTDANVLHFNGPLKPWRAMDAANAAVQGGPRVLQAYRAWQRAWHDCLTRLHLLAAHHGCHDLEGKIPSSAMMKFTAV